MVIYSSAGQVAATTVASTGAITSASLAVDNSGTIGCDADTDIITLENQSMTVADDVDVNIAKAGGLQLGGSAITSTAAELNLLDTSVAGSVVNSKAVIYSSAGQVAATTVASTGAITSASLAVDNSGTIGCDADTDIITLANQSMTVADDVDVNIAKAGGLQLGGSAITSTAAELNLLDTSVAGSVVNSKAVIYSSAGQVAATTVASTGIITGGSLTDGTATLTVGALTGLTTALTVAQGGTGAQSLTQGGILLGNGTNAITALAQKTTAGEVLKINSSGDGLEWGAGQADISTSVGLGTSVSSGSVIRVGNYSAGINLNFSSNNLHINGNIPTTSGQIIKYDGSNIKWDNPNEITYTVTVSSGKYYLNGIETPSISIQPGFTYTFDQSAGSNATHPLRFYTSATGVATY